MQRSGGLWFAMVWIFISHAVLVVFAFLVFGGGLLLLEALVLVTVTFDMRLRDIPPGYLAQGPSSHSHRPRLGAYRPERARVLTVRGVHPGGRHTASDCRSDQHHVPECQGRS